ncbi:hypothetical protein DMC01_10265 [Campylobacter troglodytis]|nr:hypothetical protein DMC01_10265 [Campylobacter troglodytis]
MLRVTRLVTASIRGFAKFRLAKFKSITKKHFILHLKEIEFRQNLRIKLSNLLKLLRENPIKES